MTCKESFWISTGGVVLLCIRSASHPEVSITLSAGGLVLLAIAPVLREHCCAEGLKLLLSEPGISSTERLESGTHCTCTKTWGALTLTTSVQGSTDTCLSICTGSSFFWDIFCGCLEQPGTPGQCVLILALGKCCIVEKCVPIWTRGVGTIKELASVAGAAVRLCVDV